MAEDAEDTVSSLSRILDQSLTAFDDEQKTVSATTRKRMAVRALQGLKTGQELVQVQALAAQLRESRAATQRIASTQAATGDANRALAVRVECATAELDASARRLAEAEEGRLAAARDAEAAARRAEKAEAELVALQVALKQREEDALRAAAGAGEAQAHASELAAECEALRAGAREAREAANTAEAALQAARYGANAERLARQRHEDAVARLTADNLVFLTRAREAEAALGAARAQATELRAALDEHRGLWFEEVAAGVEERVRAAMGRADALERELAAARGAAEEAERALRAERADLEVQLQDARAEASQLTRQLAQAGAAEAAAHEEAEAARVVAAAARGAAEERAAELRVAQETLRAMREEVNERWAAQRAAEARLSDAEGQLQASQGEAVWLRRQLETRGGELAAQQAVNAQLMARKEDVEWELMSAIAALEAAGRGASGGGGAGGGAAALPLTLQVAGELQLERPMPGIVTACRRPSSGACGAASGTGGGALGACARPAAGAGQAMDEASAGAGSAADDGRHCSDQGTPSTPLAASEAESSPEVAEPSFSVHAVDRTQLPHEQQHSNQHQLPQQGQPSGVAEAQVALPTRPYAAAVATASAGLGASVGLWGMPSLELGIAVLPGQQGSAAASAGPPSICGNDTAPVDLGAANARRQPQEQQVQGQRRLLQQPQQAALQLKAAAAAQASPPCSQSLGGRSVHFSLSGASDAQRRPRSPALAAAPGAPGGRLATAPAAPRCYGQEDAFSIRKGGSWDAGPGGSGGGPASPSRAQRLGIPARQGPTHPAMRLPAAVVTTATPAPGEQAF